MKTVLTERDLAYIKNTIGAYVIHNRKHKALSKQETNLRNVTRNLRSEAAAEVRKLLGIRANECPTTIDRDKRVVLQEKLWTHYFEPKKYKDE